MNTGIKKRPIPAKGTATVISSGNPGNRNNKIGNKLNSGNSGALRQDARILQFLKRECQRNGTGAETLQQVFSGMLSVHNRNLQMFADALKEYRACEN